MGFRMIMLQILVAPSLLHWQLVQSSSLAAPDCCDDYGGVFCQTEGQMSNLTLEEERMMQDELHRLMQENVDMK